MQNSVALGNLYKAVLCLVGGEGEIKDRLEHAASELSVVPDRNAVSPHWRDQFKSIVDEVTKTRAKFEDEGSIRATIREMTPDEARKLADRIFHLYVNMLHGDAL